MGRGRVFRNHQSEILGTIQPGDAITTAEFTAKGTYAMASLLICALVGYTVIERSRRGTGFDWRLGTDDNLFQGTARPDGLGILRGTTRRITSSNKARMGADQAIGRSSSDGVCGCGGIPNSTTRGGAAMNDVRNLHREAMRLKEEADSARRNGNVQVAGERLGQTFDHEQRAADLVAADLPQEPNRAVLHWSAPSLPLARGPLSD
jgi:hypothetical protein